MLEGAQLLHRRALRNVRVLQHRVEHDHDSKRDIQRSTKAINAGPYASVRCTWAEGHKNSLQFSNDDTTHVPCAEEGGRTHEHGEGLFGRRGERDAQRDEQEREDRGSSCVRHDVRGQVV